MATLNWHNPRGPAPGSSAAGPTKKPGPRAGIRTKNVYDFYKTGGVAAAAAVANVAAGPQNVSPYMMLPGNRMFDANAAMPEYAHKIATSAPAVPPPAAVQVAPEPAPEDDDILSDITIQFDDDEVQTLYFGPVEIIGNNGGSSNGVANGEASIGGATGGSAGVVVGRTRDRFTEEKAIVTLETVGGKATSQPLPMYLQQQKKQQQKQLQQQQQQHHQQQQQQQRQKQQQQQQQQQHRLLLQQQMLHQQQQQQQHHQRPQQPQHQQAMQHQKRTHPKHKQQMHQQQFQQQLQQQQSMLREQTILQQMQLLHESQQRQLQAQQQLHQASVTLTELQRKMNVHQSTVQQQNQRSKPPPKQHSVWESLQTVSVLQSALPAAFKPSQPKQTPRPSSSAHQQQQQIRSKVCVKEAPPIPDTTAAPSVMTEPPRAPGPEVVSHRMTPALANGSAGSVLRTLPSTVTPFTQHIKQEPVLPDAVEDPTTLAATSVETKPVIVVEGGKQQHQNGFGISPDGIECRAAATTTTSATAPVATNTVKRSLSTSLTAVTAVGGGGDAVQQQTNHAAVQQSLAESACRVAAAPGDAQAKVSPAPEGVAKNKNSGNAQHRNLQGVDIVTADILHATTSSAVLPGAVVSPTPVVKRGRGRPPKIKKLHSPQLAITAPPGISPPTGDRPKQDFVPQEEHAAKNAVYDAGTSGTNTVAVPKSARHIRKDEVARQQKGFISLAALCPPRVRKRVPDASNQSNGSAAAVDEVTTKKDVVATEKTESDEPTLMVATGNVCSPSLQQTAATIIESGAKDEATLQKDSAQGSSKPREKKTITVDHQNAPGLPQAVKESSPSSDSGIESVFDASASTNDATKCSKLGLETAEQDVAVCRSTVQHDDRAEQPVATGPKPSTGGGSEEEDDEGTVANAKANVESGRSDDGIGASEQDETTVRRPSRVGRKLSAKAKEALEVAAEAPPQLTFGDFQCRNCDMSFKTELWYKKHLTNVHRHSDTSPNGADLAPNEENVLSGEAKTMTENASLAPDTAPEPTNGDENGHHIEPTATTNGTAEGQEVVPPVETNGTPCDAMADTVVVHELVGRKRKLTDSSDEGTVKRGREDSNTVPTPSVQEPTPTEPFTEPVVKAKISNLKVEGVRNRNAVVAEAAAKQEMHEREMQEMAKQEMQAVIDEQLLSVSSQLVLDSPTLVKQTKVDENASTAEAAAAATAEAPSAAPAAAEESSVAEPPAEMAAAKLEPEDPNRLTPFEMAKVTVIEAAVGCHYKCTICGGQFSDMPAIKGHLSKVHAAIKRRSCEYCGRSFVQTGDLTRHIRIHTGHRPFKCPYVECSFAFISSGDLHKHVRRHNVSEPVPKPHVCDYCGKEFERSYDLKRHKTMHLKTEPGFKGISCEVCGKMFARKDQYRAHTYRHIGYRPYRCEVCGKTFTDPSNYSKHGRLHEMDGVEVVCYFCSRKFKNKSAISKHIFHCQQRTQSTRKTNRGVPMAPAFIKGMKKEAKIESGSGGEEENGWNDDDDDQQQQLQQLQQSPEASATGGGGSAGRKSKPQQSGKGKRRRQQRRRAPVDDDSDNSCDASSEHHIASDQESPDETVPVKRSRRSKPADNNIAATAATISSPATDTLS